MRWRDLGVLTLTALTVVAVAAPAASARPLPDGGVTAQEVAEVMRARKMPVELTTDKDGDPLINSNASGRKFGVYFYQCKNKRCTAIQFSAGFQGAEDKAARIAEWNRTKRFGRAYLDGATVYVEMDMDMEHGATTEAVANNFERWAAVVEQFPKFVNQ